MFGAHARACLDPAAWSTAPSSKNGSRGRGWGAGPTQLAKLDQILWASRSAYRSAGVAFEVLSAELVA